MDKPKDLKARAQTYSQYKSHNTMKYLISITPQGVIWCTTDSHITANSGVLDPLIPGDVILADRGFNIQNQIKLYSAKIEMPAFTCGKKQLGPVDLEDTLKTRSSSHSHWEGHWTSTIQVQDVAWASANMSSFNWWWRLLWTKLWEWHAP